jgi:DNA-binding transcriptional regulator YdaS (Cro superfamily)
MRAREFKAARDRLGRPSQAKLAKALGMSGPQMNRYEHGKVRVPGVVALAVEGARTAGGRGSKQRRLPA